MEPRIPEDMATEGSIDERAGVVDGIRVDIVRLHESWMELLFPRQRGTAHSVLGKWKPSTTLDRAKYRAWGALGVLVVSILYPLALFGFATRFYARRLDSVEARFGLLGVLLLSVLVWGGLTALARIRFDPAGFYAVAAASVVAIVAAGLSVIFYRLDGRPVTVLFAYPTAVTALFLPPVVAALYSPALSEAIFPGSTTLAAWLLDNVAPGRLAAYLRSNFDLEGLAYVAMWFGIAIPLGWVLGIMVALANVVRPADSDDD